MSFEDEEKFYAFDLLEPKEAALVTLLGMHGIRTLIDFCEDQVLLYITGEDSNPHASPKLPISEIRIQGEIIDLSPIVAVAGFEYIREKAPNLRLNLKELKDHDTTFVGSKHDCPINTRSFMPEEAVEEVPTDLPHVEPKPWSKKRKIKSKNRGGIPAGPGRYSGDEVCV